MEAEAEAKADWQILKSWMRKLKQKGYTWKQKKKLKKFTSVHFLKEGPTDLATFINR